MDTTSPPLAGAAGRALRPSATVAAAGSESKQEAPATEPPPPFTMAEEGKVVFSQRTAGGSNEPCSLGALVAHITSVRRAHAKAYSIEMRHLFNALSMLRFAKWSRDRYNSTVGSSSSSAGDRLYQRHHWTELLSSIGEPCQPEVLQGIAGLDELVGSVERKYADEIGASRERIRGGTIAFGDLTELYHPGAKLVSSTIAGPAMDVGVEVIWSKYEEGRTMFGVKRNLVVMLEVWVSLGSAVYTPIAFRDRMHQFDRSIRVDELYFCPLGSQDRRGGAGGAGMGGAATAHMAELEERGERYAEIISGEPFKSYLPGGFFPRKGAGAAASRAVDHTAARSGGRMVVDIEGGSKVRVFASGTHGGADVGCKVCIEQAHVAYTNYLRDKVSSSRGGSSSSSSSSSGGGGGQGGGGGDNNGDDDAVFVMGRAYYRSMPRSCLWKAWPTVIGFSFTSKFWGEILVKSLREIDFNAAAFDQLVLPAQRKALIRAVVEYEGHEGSSCDVISGKGEGSVFLLCTYTRNILIPLCRSVRVSACCDL